MAFGAVGLWFGVGRQKRSVGGAITLKECCWTVQQEPSLRCVGEVGTAGGTTSESLRQGPRPR